jgi:pimeloyl-ACP methyl ester carboxylesterase
MSERPILDATRTAGQAVGQVAAWVGRQAAAAWRGVDPDLRTHLAQLPLVGLTLLARGSAEVPALPDDGHRPVVFVHGLGGGPGNFQPMRIAFRLRGRSRTFAPALPRGVPVADLGSVLAAYVEELAARNGLPGDAQIDLVCHSMGGLVARLALEDPRCRARVATLVTLGTPHSGSHLARYGAMDASLCLRPGSEVMERLAAQVPWPGPPAMPRLVSLWSQSDVILLPATSACLGGAENVEMPGFTHYSYLLRPEAWRRVFDALVPGTSEARTSRTP